MAGMRRQTILLILAVLAVSWAAPLIRLAHGAPALAIAFWRTTIATAAIAPIVIVRYRAELRRIQRGDVLVMILSGVLLAIHFASWIASVGLTTVAASALLVATQPVFVALASGLIGDKVSKRAWLGIVIAVAGGLIVAGADLGGSSRSLLGDGLAVLGAICAAGYLLIGRGLRRRYSVLPYVFVVYGCCSVVLLVAMLVTRTSFTSYGRSSWWAIIAISLGPQLFGHTTFNYLLERLKASQVAVAIMGEPVGSTFIAMLLFREVPGVLVLPGGLLLLLGIGLSLTVGATAGNVAITE